MALVKNNNKTRDAKVWVSNGIRSPRSTTWKVLPLHTAIVLGAPFELVLEIMNAYPQAVARKDINGSLPIHLAACSLQDSDGERIFKQLLNLHPRSCYAKDRDGNTPYALLQRTSYWSESMDARRKQEIIDLINQESCEGIEALIESRDDENEEESSCTEESVLFPVEALEIESQMNKSLKSVSTFTEPAKFQESFEGKVRMSLTKCASFTTLASSADCGDDSEAFSGPKKHEGRAENQVHDGQSQISSSTGVNSIRKRLKKANTKLHLTKKIAESSPVRLMRRRNGDYLSLSHLGDYESPFNGVKTSRSEDHPGTDDSTPTREQLLYMARFWKAAVDKKTGETYYYHRKTRQVKWSKPALFDEAQWSSPPLFSQSDETNKDDIAKELCRKPSREQDVEWDKENNKLVAFGPASRCKSIPKSAIKFRSPKKRNSVASSRALKRLDSAPTKLSYTSDECENDMNCDGLDEADGLTQLLRSIQQQDWQTALNRAASCPHEASVWAERKVRGYLLWRYLPIHASIARHAPVELVAELLRAYPDAARLRDYTANLPIHIAAKRINESKEMGKIYNHLYQAFPESIVIEDGKGRTAPDLLKKNGRGAYEFLSDSIPKDEQKRIQAGQKRGDFTLESSFTAFSDNTTTVLDPIEDHDKMKSGYIHVKFDE